MLRWADAASHEEAEAITGADGEPRQRSRSEQHVHVQRRTQVDQPQLICPGGEQPSEGGRLFERTLAPVTSLLVIYILEPSLELTARFYGALLDAGPRAGLWRRR